MDTVLPTFLIVPGAFHLPDTYSLLASKLQFEGFPTRTVRLPSAGGTGTGLEEDISAIKSALTSIVLAQNRDVIVLCHSYGGFPTGGAIDGFCKAEQTGGAGIVGIIYLCAFLPPKGSSLTAMTGGTFPSWQTVHKAAGAVTVAEPRPVFYADVLSPLVRSVEVEIVAQSLKSLCDPAPAPDWAASVCQGRRAYIRCTEDQAIPVSVQDAMIEASGVEWIIKTLNTSHSPFLSAPDTLTAMLKELAKTFATAPIQ